MPLFPNDFKKFKHIESDDKTTTLEHPHGHRIIISHKALKGPMREQLMALAKGGKVTKTVPIKKSEPMSKDCAPAMMADGGSPELAPNVIDTIKNYNRLTTQRLPGDGPAVPIADPFGPNNEMPDDVNMGLYKQAQEKVDTAEQRDIELAAAEQQRKQEFAKAQMQAIQDKNSMRADFGKPPLPIPPELAAIAQPDPQGAVPQSIETPNQGIPQNVTQPNVATPTAPAITASTYPGMKEAEEGLNLAKEGQIQQAKEQEDILKRSRIAEADAMNVYEGKHAMITNEIKALQDDIAAGHIDPAKFWNNRSRVAAGIGMILAGFDPAGRPNAAINFLNQEMDRDLQAQKADLGRKENLLSANMKMLGNDREAYDLTRIMQKEMVANELGQAAARAVNPMAKAAALQALGKLKIEIAPEVQKLAATQAIAQLNNDSKNDPSKMDNYLAGLDKVDPKKAEEMRERAIPGVGFANTKEDATFLKEVEARRGAIKDNATKMINMIKDKGTYEMFGPHNETLNMMADQIATDMAKMQDPSSTARESEVNLVKKNLTEAGVSKSNATAQKIIKEFYKTVDERAGRSYSLRGVKPPVSGGLQSTTKIINGVKYQVSPDGKSATRVKD